MAEKQSWFNRTQTVRVVSHHPLRPWLTLLAVVVLSAGGAVGGYWLGRATAKVDDVHVVSVERLNEANEAALARLQAQLVDADLARTVDRDAAQTLKESIRELRDKVASLTEEVTFYKSLMAPSSLDRGLQIADFELTPKDPDRYTFHLLLTQVASRRDWVQGSVTVTVHGRMTAAAGGAAMDGSDSATGALKQVLPLTEIGEEGNYPLKFRFRYFQDLTGVMRLPPGFEPEQVVVEADRRGASAEPLSRTFAWTVAG
ncbi:MAG: hypothetical protein PVH91_02160 [Pseudomonadales bacterium]|jgi:hypothetical protein